MPEVRGQDPDDGEALGLLWPVAHIGGHGAADDGWITAEMADPEPVADQRDIGAAGREGVRREGVTNRGTDAKRLHEAVGDPRAGSGLGVIAAEQVEHVEVPGDRVLDHVAQGGPVQPLHFPR